MAIGPGYKTFTFDGQNSGSYHVNITGEAVYNAPEREVEMITIPGRDGEFAHDKGRYENIPVKYPAGMFGDDQSAFAAKIRALRNMMASRVGYCRLEDGYNPDEYRLAVYKSGLEVEPVPFQRAGEFDILFDCKPQRFLKSGEAAVAVASGGYISNPTLHASKPLLEVKGHGTIKIGDKDVILNDVKFVNVDYPVEQTPAGSVKAKDLDDGRLNVGDTVTASNVRYIYSIEFPAGYTVTGHSITVQSSDFTHTLNISRRGRFIDVIISATSISMGYSATTVAKTVVVSGYINYTDANGTAGTLAATGTAMYQMYDGEEARLSISVSTANNNLVTRVQDTTVGSIQALSTASVLGSTSYIDCENGMAYRYINSKPVGINKAVVLPAELPTLKPGANSISYSGTITEFKIVPRWWEV